MSTLYPINIELKTKKNPLNPDNLYLEIEDYIDDAYGSPKLDAVKIQGFELKILKALANYFLGVTFLVRVLALSFRFSWIEDKPRIFRLDCVELSDFSCSNATTELITPSRFPNFL